MNTATRSVAVVATRVPNIDRRALSQAWYSALHLAHDAARAPAAKVSPGVAIAAASPRASGAGSAGTPSSAPASTAPRQTPHSTLRGENRERRDPAPDLARRMQRALAQHTLPGGAIVARPATIALKLGDGRVQLLVRHDGATTRIVALCPPHLRERVDRALAHARFALAAAGTRIEAA